MEETPEIATQRPGTARSGFTLLDGIALVMGGAIASVHLRQATPSGSLSGAGWAMIWLTFSGVALTSAGPFLTLIRTISGRPGTPQRLGDRLWTLLGAPWILGAIPRIVSSSDPKGNEFATQLQDFLLATGLGIATLVTVAVIWSRWVMVPSEGIREQESESWTHRLGLVLAVAWPLQCGLGMVVMGTPD